MRKLWKIGLSVCLAASNIGCVVALGNRGALTVPAKQVVAVDGEIYIVDFDGQRIRKIDPETIEHADTVDWPAEETSD